MLKAEPSNSTSDGSDFERGNDIPHAIVWLAVNRWRCDRVSIIYVVREIAMQIWNNWLRVFGLHFGLKILQSFKYAKTIVLKD